MRTLRPWLLASTLALGGILALAGSAAAAPPNHCRADEQLVFGCKLENKAKLLSLCASRDLGPKRGYLQYRFGALGKVELSFPSDTHDTQQAFQYSYEASPDHIREASTTLVTFRNRDVVYTIYSNVFDATVESQGIRIQLATSAGAKIIDLPCELPAEGELTALGKLLR